MRARFLFGLAAFFGSDVADAQLQSVLGPVEEGPFWADAKPYKDTRRRRTRRRRTFKSDKLKKKEADAEDAEVADTKHHNAKCHAIKKKILLKFANWFVDDKGRGRKYEVVEGVKNHDQGDGDVSPKRGAIVDKSSIDNGFGVHIIDPAAQPRNIGADDLHELLHCSPDDMEDMWREGSNWWEWIKKHPTFEALIADTAMSKVYIPCPCVNDVFPCMDEVNNVDHKQGRHLRKHMAGWREVGGLLGGLKLNRLYHHETVEGDKDLHCTICEIEYLWFWELLTEPLKNFILSGDEMSLKDSLGFGTSGNGGFF